MEKVGIVGAGTMGAGIAYNFVRANIPVVITDVDAVQRSRCRAYIVNLLEREVARGRLAPHEVESRLLSLTVTDNATELSRVDLAIESVPERLNLKTSVLQELDCILPPISLIATNTSALSITALARATGRPERIAGFHFFYPAHTMRLVEVVAGKDTSSETLETLGHLSEEIRKYPVMVRECPGFVVNRVLMRALA